MNDNYIGLHILLHVWYIFKAERRQQNTLLQSKFKPTPTQNFFHWLETLILSLHLFLTSPHLFFNSSKEKKSFYVIPNLNSSLKSVKRFTLGKLVLFFLPV